MKIFLFAIQDKINFNFINKFINKVYVKRNYQIQSEIEGVIDKYDEEMGYFQRKINEISKEYTVEKQQLEWVLKA